jgi:outer membrane protein TolC
MNPGLGRIVASVILLASIDACSSYTPLPLERHVEGAERVEQLHHDGSLPAKLGVEDIAVLALQNNPALRAARAQRGVAQAQLRAAGILPNPSLGASYAFLLGGPGTTGALSASITQDVRSIVLISNRQDAARESARSVDASVVWQEWQTLAKARLLAIDLIEGARQLRLLRESVDLLQDRLTRSRRSLADGDSSLAGQIPDLVAAADGRRQLDDLERQQEARRRDLSVFLGLAPQAPLVLSEQVDLAQLDAAAIRQSLPGLADRRPDLVALQLGYRAQEEKLRGAILAQFPLFSLGVTGSRDTSNVRSLGPQVTLDLPIFDRNQGNIAIEGATRQQLHDEFTVRLFDARSEALALLADQEVLRSQYRTRLDQLAELDAAARGADDALRAGNLDERGWVDLQSARNAKSLEIVAMEQNLLDQQTVIGMLVGTGMPPISFVPPGDSP